MVRKKRNEQRSEGAKQRRRFFTGRVFPDKKIVREVVGLSLYSRSLGRCPFKVPFSSSSFWVNRGRWIQRSRLVIVSWIYFPGLCFNLGLNSWPISDTTTNLCSLSLSLLQEINSLKCFLTTVWYAARSSGKQSLWSGHSIPSCILNHSTCPPTKNKASSCHSSSSWSKNPIFLANHVFSFHVWCRHWTQSSRLSSTTRSICFFTKLKRTIVCLFTLY